MTLWNSHYFQSLYVFIPGGALALGATVFIQGSFLLGYPILSFSDPDWIRFQSGQWIRIRIRIQEGKNGPQK